MKQQRHAHVCEDAFVFASEKQSITFSPSLSLSLPLSPPGPFCPSNLHWEAAVVSMKLNKSREKERSKRREKRTEEEEEEEKQE